MRADIPDKLYFKIGEVSKLACVEPHVLRYWETEFNEIQPKRANSNQRLYRRVDVETILQIKSLLHKQKFTISILTVNHILHYLIVILHLHLIFC